jgi:hypothetical protein
MAALEPLGGIILTSIALSLVIALGVGILSEILQ